MKAITMGGFVEFASASASGRIGAVQNVITNQAGDYEPSHDFYRQFRIAIAEGIANGDDVLRVRRAVEACSPRRRGNYVALETGWNAWRRKKHLEVFSQPLTWQVNGLEVRVSPQFIYHRRRESLLVWPYLKKDELSRDGIQAAIRLMELAYPDTSYRPAVLDVRRGVLTVATRRKRNFDAWLAGEAAAFLSMAASIRGAA